MIFIIVDLTVAGVLIVNAPNILANVSELLR